VPQSEPRVIHGLTRPEAIHCSVLFATERRHRLPSSAHG
jgi:hypothetical protein